MNTLLNKLNQKKSGKKGFTLMEMLIVVAIIAILVAIAIPTFSNALTKAQIATDEANLRSYYSESIMNYMLNEDDTATLPVENTAKKTVEVAGTTYELKAGEYTVTSDTTKGTMTITYKITKGSQNGTTVVIPGAETTPAQG